MENTFETSKKGVYLQWSFFDNHGTRTLLVGITWNHYSLDIIQRIFFSKDSFEYANNTVAFNPKALLACDLSLLFTDDEHIERFVKLIADTIVLELFPEENITQKEEDAWLSPHIPFSKIEPSFWKHKLEESKSPSD